MAKERWQQLDRYLYCAEINQSFKSPFNRVWDLSEVIRERAFKYWTVGVHLCVDEAIARFTGRASEIVIIKTKPTPECFKIWCLASDGVILNWLFHARGAGRGPVNLLRLADDAASAFTPTDSVPITLVLAVDAEGRRLFPPNLHIVWDDNLFNTIPMLEYLRSQGVGCAGTKLAKESFSSDLMRLKTQHTCQLEWGEIRWALSKSKQVFQAAWRDNQVVLFASTVAEPTQEVVKLRRRSKLTQKDKKLFRKAFVNEPTKLLGIPQMIDEYNCHMSEVDR
ncbi:hypothetical protein BU23DRAFT_633124, partial [Bimuria novae-zelandiae CBS 107.79]